MEHLIRSKGIFSTLSIVLVLVTQSLIAQSHEEIKEAFQQSYAFEISAEYEKGIEVLRKIYNEESYEVNIRLGWLSYLSGNFQESMAYYKRAASIMPYAIEPRFGIVYPASAMGNWDFVLKQYEEVLEINPNNSIALFRCGMIYYGRNDYQKAKEYFLKVINLYPFDYDGLNMMGWTYFALGNKNEAKIMFQKALYAQPSGESAAEGLSKLKQ